MLAKATGLDPVCIQKLRKVEVAKRHQLCLTTRHRPARGAGAVAKNQGLTVGILIRKVAQVAGRIRCWPSEVPRHDHQFCTATDR